MNNNTNQTSSNSYSSTSSHNCTPCRILGTTTLAGSSAYVWYHARQIPRNQILDRVILSGFSITLFTGAIWRWFIIE
jgi:hypothetical protein